MDKTQKAQSTKLEIDKWDYLKEASVHQRKQTSVWGDDLQNGRKYLQTIHLTKARKPEDSRVFQNICGKDKIVILVWKFLKSHIAFSQFLFYKNSLKITLTKNSKTSTTNYPI